jgi:hypothetical protein
MRVERALDRLSAALARRGITSTAAAVGLALAHQSGAALPAGLAATVTGAALAGTAAHAGWIAAFLSMSKLQIGIAGAIGTAGVIGFGIQAQTNANLRREIAALRPLPQAISALRTENQQLASVAAEIETLRRDDAEFKQLAQSVAEVQKAQAENARLVQLREGERNVQAEIDRMNREGNALVEQFKTLTAQAKNTSLTAEERAQAEAAAKIKLEQIKAKQREVQAYIANARLTYPNLPIRKIETSRLSANGNPAASGESGVPGQSGRLHYQPTPGWSAPSPPTPPADSDRISLRLPQSDPNTALLALEKLMGIKLVRDASVATLKGTLDFETGPVPREAAARLLNDALRKQLNIFLESRADGTVVARLGPPR